LEGETKMTNPLEKQKLKFTCSINGTAEIRAVDFETARNKLEYAVKRELRNRYIYRGNIEFTIKNHKNLKIKEVKLKNGKTTSKI